MEADVRDALVAWQGGELPPGREEELRARMGSDADFRRVFAEEAWTLSLARVAQAPAPRWLALHEELGLAPSAQAPTQEQRETALLTALRREAPRFVNVRWRRAAYSLMAAAAGLILFVFFRPIRQPEADGKSPILAVVVQSENAVWKSGGPGRFPVGAPLGASRLELVSGRARLMFSSGATLDFAGPADIDLLAMDRVMCREGRLRTKAPHGAEGFCVETPHGTVTDLGTELGISVTKDGKTSVAVFEGRAEVSLQISGQHGVRSALLKAGDSAELIPATGEIRPESDGDFLSASALHLPPLPVSSQYAETILAAKPRHYWRLDRESAGAIPDEIGNGSSLRLAGGARVQPGDTGRPNAYFPGNSAPGALYLEAPLPMPASSHAVEIWFVAESTGLMSLGALTSVENERRHLTLIEVGGNRPGHPPEAGVVRYLMRWPASSRGGMNIYTLPGAFPCQWHHLVAQQAGGDMQLFIDGKSAGTAQATAIPDGVACTLHFGCLAYREGDQQAKLERAFSGRMAEIAIYDRLLTLDEVRQHARLGGRISP